VGIGGLDSDQSHHCNHNVITHTWGQLSHHSHHSHAHTSAALQRRHCTPKWRESLGPTARIEVRRVFSCVGWVVVWCGTTQKKREWDRRPKRR
jgi:hypothetical protein